MENKSIRIRTTPGGDDKYVKVDLNQTFDQLEILSLKINQDKLYTSFSSDYGVLVGRVIANEGKGIENARVSIFIPVSEEDENDPRLGFLYPYKSVTDRNALGIRYNLLPKGGRYIRVRRTTTSVAFPEPPNYAPQGLIDMYGGGPGSVGSYQPLYYYHNNHYVAGTNPNFGKQIDKGAWLQIGKGYIQQGGGKGSNCDNSAIQNFPNPSTYPGNKAGTDFNNDGYYTAVYKDAYLKLSSIENPIPTNVTPNPQVAQPNDNQAREIWNESFYVAKQGYTLWKIEGQSGITFQNIPSTFANMNSNVDIRTVIYTLTKCKFKAVQPSNLPTQISGWSLITDNTDSLTGGTSTWECTIDVGIGNGPPVPVGTFPNDYEILDNDDVLEIYDKYYKYTTRTNASGDYMIFGVPVGTQIVHMDVDLSDIGADSLTANDLRSSGIPDALLNGNDFKFSQDLDTLPQIITQNVSVNIIPLWGDTNLSDVVGITRYDFKITIKSNPTAMLCFAYGLDDDISNKYYYTGDVDDDYVIGYPGKTENMKPSVDGAVPVYTITKYAEDYNSTSSASGVLEFHDTSKGYALFILPCDQDKVINDEFGNLVPSGDPNKGIGTTGRYVISAQVSYSGPTPRPQYYAQGIMNTPQGAYNRVFKYQANRKYSVKQQMYGEYKMRYSSTDSLGYVWPSGAFPQLSNADYVNGFIYFGSIYTNFPPINWLVGPFGVLAKTYIMDITDYFDDLVSLPPGFIRIAQGSTIASKMVNSSKTPQDGGTTPQKSVAALDFGYIQEPGSIGSEILFLKGIHKDWDIFKYAKKFAR